MPRGMALAIWMAVLGTAGTARAGGNPDFASWKSHATPVEDLSGFLTQFVGVCDNDPLTNRECKAQLAAFRKKSVNQVFSVTLGPDAQKMVQPRSFNTAKHSQEFSLTPFFAGSGFALTQGQPKHLGRDGNPVMPMVRLTSKFGDGGTPEMISHEFSTGSVTVELVFRPTGVWRLPRKDQPKAFYQGVKAQFLALHLSGTRSGQELGSAVMASK
jgi:hypothetical protein